MEAERFDSIHWVHTYCKLKRYIPTMDEVRTNGLPARTTSKCSKSSNPLQTDSQPAQRSSRPLSVSPPSVATSSPIALRSRPGLGSQTSSAPFVPLRSGAGSGSIDPRFSTTIEDDSQEGPSLQPRSYRNSVASIKDDPFFRNYQSPHSVSLARELRSATYSERLHNDDDVFEDPPRRSNKRPSVENSVNVPVCESPQTTFAYELFESMD